MFSRAHVNEFTIRSFKNILFYTKSVYMCMCMDVNIAWKKRRSIRVRTLDYGTWWRESRVESKACIHKHRNTHILRQTLCRGSHEAAGYSMYEQTRSVRWWKWMISFTEWTRGYEALEALSFSRYFRWRKTRRKTRSLTRRGMAGCEFSTFNVRRWTHDFVCLMVSRWSYLATSINFEHSRFINAKNTTLAVFLFYNAS